MTHSQSIIIQIFDLHQGVTQYLVLKNVYSRNSIIVYQVHILDNTTEILHGMYSLKASSSLNYLAILARSQVNNGIESNERIASDSVNASCIIVHSLRESSLTLVIRLLGPLEQRPPLTNAQQFRLFFKCTGLSAPTLSNDRDTYYC